MVQNISVAYFPVVDTGDVVYYNLRILSATIMICYDREDCRKYNTTASSTEVNTRDDRGVLVQYITGALSTGVIKGEDRTFYSTK